MPVLSMCFSFCSSKINTLLTFVTSSQRAPQTTSSMNESDTHFFCPPTFAAYFCVGSFVLKNMALSLFSSRIVVAVVWRVSLFRISDSHWNDTDLYHLSLAECTQPFSFHVFKSFECTTLFAFTFACHFYFSFRSIQAIFVMKGAALLWRHMTQNVNVVKWKWWNDIK